ncbi:MAG: hypothetical protein BroJett042_21960 [Bacteroidota bacterium]|nr:MAG: helix-turn-helix domain-containing protein [Bacteroidetes bacterium OLB12]GIL23683.1 MAG: hypothetical protein BroJett042_21960 [Bacteroidota bacterium]
MEKRQFTAYNGLIMDFKAIGKAVRERRKSRKILQADLADIAGISPRTLRDIEKGTANPELETLMKLCQALGMEVRVEIIK